MQVTYYSLRSRLRIAYCFLDLGISFLACCTCCDEFRNYHFSPRQATMIDATTTILLFLPFLSHILSHCLFLFHCRYTVVCFSLSLSTRALVDCSTSDFSSAVACFVWSDRFASREVSAAHYLRRPEPQLFHSLTVDCQLFMLFTLVSFAYFSSLFLSLSISASWLLTSLVACLLIFFCLSTDTPALLIFCCTI